MNTSSNKNRYFIIAALLCFLFFYITFGIASIIDSNNPKTYIIYFIELIIFPVSFFLIPRKVKANFQKFGNYCMNRMNYIIILVLLFFCLVLSFVFLRDTISCDSKIFIIYSLGCFLSTLTFFRVRKFVKIIIRHISKYWFIYIPIMVSSLLLLIWIYIPSFEVFLFGDTKKTNFELLTYLGAIISGIFVFGNLFETSKRNNFTQKINIANSFKDAATLLGSQDASSFYAGVIAFHQIAEDCKRLNNFFYVEKIKEIFCGKVRQYKDNDISLYVQPILDKLAKSKIYYPTDSYFYRLFNKVSGMDFQGANLTGVDLTNANLLFANLTNTNLSHANLSRAKLIGAKLIGVKCDPIIIPDLNPELKDANFSGADFSGADLSNSDLSGVNLSNADLSNSKLTGAEFSGLFLPGLSTEDDTSNYKVTEGITIKANLTGAKFQSAHRNGIELPSGKKYDALFEEAKKIVGSDKMTETVLLKMFELSKDKTD